MKGSRFRKLAAFFLAAVMLALTGNTGAVIVNGQWVIFTIANDELLPLNAATMPYMYNSVVYVPYSVFTDYLGIRSMYNAKDDVLILVNSEKTLFYDMKNETAYDDKDYAYARKALTYNGLIYVPARFTAEFFGLTYSYDYEIPVVRLRDADTTYSDAYIKTYYEQEFAARLEAYQQAPPEEPDPETATPAPVYLMFTGELNDYTNTILDTLEGYGIKAMFFLNAETIRAHEDIVRRLYVAGHMIGVSATNSVPESPESLLASFDAANEALFAVLRTVGRCVYLPGGSRNEVYDASYFDALAAAGYRYWDFTVIAEDYLDYASGASVRDSVIEALISVEFVQTLAMHSTQAAAEALPGLLDYIIEREGTVVSADPLTAAVTF